MKVIVPLAGPDFEGADGVVKAERLIDGRPLLRYALESRAWWQDGDVSQEDLIFVLRDSEPSRRFADGPLAEWYPSSQRVFLSSFTGGAALSVLPGLALAAHEDTPICVDLADIIYRAPSGISQMFQDPTVGGIGLVFPSGNPAYSYMRSIDGEVVEAAEKRVISNDASAGTYFFSNAATYLMALSGNLANPAAVTHRGLFFVCPVFNGVLASGRRVLKVPVDDVFDVKIA